MNEKLRIKAFYPNFFYDQLIAYVSLRIIKNFNDKHVTADIMGICSNNTVDKFRKIEFDFNAKQNKKSVRKIYRDAIPFRIWQILSKVIKQDRIKKYAEKRFLRGLKSDDIVYLWPGASIELYRQIKKTGCKIVTEMINTMQSTSKAILDQEFTSLGIPISHNISDAAVNHDTMTAKLSDYIFSPSPGVTQSILSEGVPYEKILQTSYGLKRREILNGHDSTIKDKKFTMLFVGSICVRKGIHLLLDAWANSKVDGKLQIVGRVSTEIKDMFEESIRKYPSIEHIDFLQDLKPVYSNADVFILPSLEEGSPLVTYLALGAGLPVIASDMGGGGVITDGQEGIIIDPHNQSEIIDAIKKMKKDLSLRKRASIASKSKAEQFTWEKVAESRKKILIDRISTAV